MMDVEIRDDVKFESGVWDYIINGFSEVKNKHYSKVIVEKNKNVSKVDLNMLGSENNIILCFADGEKCVDLIATDRGQEISLLLVELDAKKMRKDGWKPVFNSKKDTILMWAKPPFMLSCVDLCGVPFTKPVKGLVNLFVKTANKMKRFDVVIDFSEAEKALGSLMMETKKREYVNAKRNVDDVLRKVDRYSNDLANMFSNLRQAQETLNVAEILKKKKVSVKGILDNVLKIEGVRFVTVENDKIIVVTNSLTSLPFTYSGRKRVIDLGSYKISWGRGKAVMIRNLGRVRGYEYDHPHVKNGIPCWGNMKEIIGYAQEFNIEVVVQMILSYLVSLNPNGWYRNGVDWSKEFRGR